MNFENYDYKRPDIKKTEEEYSNIICEFLHAETAEIQFEAMKKMNDNVSNLYTMLTLVNIRHDANVKEEFYLIEKEFMNEFGSIFEATVFQYYNALVKSKFRKEIIERYGDHIFTLAELTLKTFKPEIVHYLIEENQLISKYKTLIASALINYEGNEYNLSEMSVFMQSKNREIRRCASEAVGEFFEDNEKKFDEIYDSLVNVRHKMAIDLGYDNFVQLGYDKLNRSDYDSKMVKKYRNQVYKTIVPIVQKLKQRQGKRIGIENMKYYDEPLKFKTGNANLKGDMDMVIRTTMKMMNELSSDTSNYYTKMHDCNLMDLETRKNKSGGAYCTYLPSYKSPFLFANLNGTASDIGTFTHELGHGFHCYSCQNIEIPLYISPTMEVAEIHSMSMEFFTWPWMEEFFGDDTEKYKFNHMVGSISFIPYGVAVDEFQHIVYENPYLTPNERKLKWREIEKKYLPSLDYDGNEFLNRGGYWFRQAHIFNSPFYYIDYTIAQICALEYWHKSNENPTSTWYDYSNLCKAGGSLPFSQLLEVGHLSNPFEDGSLDRVLKPVISWLDSIDDINL